MMTYLRIVLILGCMLSVAISVTAGERPCDRGAIVIDGNILISQASAKGPYGRQEVAIASMQAAVGRFMADHFMLGLGGSFYTDSRGYVGDLWSLGPIVGVYMDPAAESNRVEGAFLPFARVFFYVGGADAYNGDSYYSFGGDLGVTAMVNRTVGLEMSIGLTQEWATNVPVMVHDLLGYEQPGLKNQSGTTILFGIGLTGFLF